MQVVLCRVQLRVAAIREAGPEALALLGVLVGVRVQDLQQALALRAVRPGERGSSAECARFGGVQACAAATRVSVTSECDWMVS